MPILEQMLYYALYTGLWAGLYALLGLFKNHHLFRQPFQRINWLSTFHYAFVTPLLVASYFIDPPAFAYNIPPTELLNHSMLMMVGYYIFSIIHNFLSGQNDKMGIIHHIAFGLVMVILLTWGDFPRFWMWIMVAQFPGVLFHSMLALRRSEQVNPLWTLRLEKIHLWVYILFRKVFQTIIAVLFIYLDLKEGVSTYFVLFALCIPTITLSFILNTIWLKQAIVHLRKEQSRLAQLGIVSDMKPAMQPAIFVNKNRNTGS